MTCIMTGTLAGDACTTLCVAADDEHACTPEAAARDIARLLAEHPAWTHADRAGATVVAVGNSRRAPWLGALATTALTASLDDGPERPGPEGRRSVWVTEDVGPRTEAVCVAGDATWRPGMRAPYRRPGNR